MCTDSCSPFSNKDFELGLSKVEVRKIFRTGNKLVELAVKDEMCPLGSIGRHLSYFRRWNESLHYSLSDYFENLYQAEIGIAWAKYTRPVVRGTSGELYSAQDMDNAMMYGG